MTISEIEQYIKNDDDSVFLEIPQWRLLEKKQEIFNLCINYDATKCLDSYIHNIGFDIDVLIKNNTLSIEELKKLFELDKDYLLDGDFDRSDKLLLALKYQNINAFFYLCDNFSNEYSDLLGFSYEEAYSKNDEFISHTTAYYAINIGLSTIVEKLCSLYQSKIDQLKINISAVQAEVKTYNCDSDIKTLNELTFYDNLLKKGLLKMQESLKHSNIAA